MLFADKTWYITKDYIYLIIPEHHFFSVWQILPFANTGLTDYEKDNIIKGYDYPPGKPVIIF